METVAAMQAVSLPDYSRHDRKIDAILRADSLTSPAAVTFLRNFIALFFFLFAADRERSTLNRLF